MNTSRPITFTSNGNDIKQHIQDPLDIPPTGMYAPIPQEVNNDEVTEFSEKEIMVRRMHTDEVPPQDTPILIMDNAADLSMIG
jgi:hypothetical protein